MYATAGRRDYNQKYTQLKNEMRVHSALQTYHSWIKMAKLDPSTYKVKAELPTNKDTKTHT